MKAKRTASYWEVRRGKREKYMREEVLGNGSLTRDVGWGIHFVEGILEVTSAW